MALIIRILALRRWRHWSLQNNLQGNPMALVYGTWPIYTLAWFMALLRIPLGFRPTPKTRSGRLNPSWLAPQIITSLLLIIGLGYTLFSKNGMDYLLVLAFATAQVTVQLLFLGRILHEMIIGTPVREIKLNYLPVGDHSRLPARVTDPKLGNIGTPGP
jgi:hypothetical protein